MNPLLPVHPRTGLTAVGIVGGRPVWPIMGAGPDDPSNENHPPEGGQGGDGGANNPPEGGGTGQPPAQQQPPAQPPAQQAPPARTPEPAPGQHFSAEYVAQLREEAAGYRTKLRSTEQERDAAKNDLTPAQEKAQAAARELAVFRTAGKVGANPDALNDSMAFQTAVSKLDPASDTFSADLESAMKSAVEANTTLRVSQGPRRSGGAEFTGGSGGSGERPKSIRAAYAARSK